MNLSIFLAKVLGSYLVILSLFSIVRYPYIEDLFKNLKEQRGTVFIFALLPVIFGLLLVISHNLWVADWRVVITIIGWLMLFSGIYRLFFQDGWMDNVEWWINHKGISLAIMVLFFLVGCYLAYKGFSTSQYDPHLMINS